MGKIVNKAELAEIFNVPESTIEAWERGEDLPFPDHGGKMVARVELAEILGLTEPELTRLQQDPSFPVLAQPIDPHRGPLADTAAALTWFIRRGIKNRLWN